MPFDPHWNSVGTAGAEPTPFQRGRKALPRPLQTIPVHEKRRALEYMFKGSFKTTRFDLNTLLKSFKHETNFHYN